MISLQHEQDIPVHFLFDYQPPVALERGGWVYILQRSYPHSQFSTGENYPFVPEPFN